MLRRGPFQDRHAILVHIADLCTGFDGPQLHRARYTASGLESESTDTFDARCLAGVDEYFVCPHNLCPGHTS